MSNSQTVDISGLDKLTVLKAMWKNSKPALFFNLTKITPPALNEEEARRSLKNGYVDYLCGRVIKTNFTTNRLDTWGYDRDNGDGALQRVVNSLRSI